MIHTNNKKVSFAPVFLGLLFFTNPYFSVVDVLPDFIGCALIFLGLSRVAQINRQMSEARAAFLKLFVYCALKDLAVMISFLVFTGTERPVALLTVSFINAIASFYLSYHAFYSLFDGFYSLAVIHDCPALYQNVRHESLIRKLYVRLRTWEARRKGFLYEPRPVTERCRTEQILRTSIVFLLFREILGALPEFSALSTSDYLDTGLIHLYDYIGVMRGISVFFMLFVSAWWLVTLCRYFSVVARQKEFLQILAEKYAEFVRSHPGVAILRRFGIALSLIGVGGFLLCDFYLDLKNVIPDWIGVLFLLLGIVLLKTPWYDRVIGAVATLAFGALAVVSTQYTYYFHVYHTAVEISKTEAAATAYRHMWVSSLGEFLLFLVFLVVLLLIVRRVIREWAGYMPTHKDLEFEQRRRASFIEEFDGDLLRVFVFGFISGLISFLYDYIQEIPDARIYRLLEFLWGIDLTAGLVFAVLLAATLGNVYREIQHRFCFEE